MQQFRSWFPIQHTMTAFEFRVLVHSVVVLFKTMPTHFAKMEVKLRLPTIHYLSRGSIWFIPTCELLEAFLLSQNVTNNTLCGTSQALVADYCGCHGATISKGCSFCPNGQIVPLPDTELNIFGLPFNTCGQLESVLSLVIQDGTEMCSTFQKFSSYCGCKVAKNACKMCPHGEIGFPDKTLTSLMGNAGIPAFDPTCKIFEALT
jgi:hypothetical protein